MLRFLKWIFFVFGGLGLVIMSFFYIQNKTDLHLYFNNKSSLEYSTVQNTCPEISDTYYFPCFFKQFKVYIGKVSLTGISLGLKTAFTFIDTDKENNKKFESTEMKVRYALNHLMLNNLALSHSTKRFHGLQFTYGGYIGKVKDFLSKAQSFSDGIINGLKSDEGISSLGDAVKRDLYQSEFSRIEAEYQTIQLDVNSWLDREIKQLKAKHNVE